MQDEYISDRLMFLHFRLFHEWSEILLIQLNDHNLDENLMTRREENLII
jgi:hypothetical protein